MFMLSFVSKLMFMLCFVWFCVSDPSLLTALGITPRTCYIFNITLIPSAKFDIVFSIMAHFNSKEGGSEAQGS